MDTPPKTGHPVLTNDQIAFFNEFGFLVFRQLFDSKELETMAERFSQGGNRPGGAGGQRPGGAGGQRPGAPGGGNRPAPPNRGQDLPKRSATN